MGDSDCIVVGNISTLFIELLAREDWVGFSAAPDIFPPDKFNAGFLVIKPNRQIFNAMMDQISTTFSYDNGDTGFLNHFFSGWYHMLPACSRLPFGFNAQRTLHWYTYNKQPAYWESINPLMVIHFSSSPKPWEDQSRQTNLETMWYQYYNESQLFLQNLGSNISNGKEQSNQQKEQIFREKFKRYRKMGFDSKTAMSKAREEGGNTQDLPAEVQVAAMFGFGMQN